MRVAVPVLLSLVLSVTSAMIPQANDVPQRRQFMGYSNNIVHENPNYPDQTAQSSVKVTFNPNQDIQRPLYHPHYQPDVTNSYPTHAPQSQLFNVGYSVQFSNGAKPKPKPKSKFQRMNNNLDDGEIITGTRKQNEEVQVPNVNFSPQDFVTTALISNKQQKISGIKPKPHFFGNYPNPKALLNQANLSPTTQKYYKSLEQLKPQPQNIQELQQKYSWRNLSPGVEIIRSTEVPTVSQKYARSEQSIHFDHAKALGRSQDFDYSNAVDSSVPQQTTLYYNNIKNPQIYHAKLPTLQQVQSMAMSKMNHISPKTVSIDATLLNEQVPLQVDTRLVEEAMKNPNIALYNSQFSQTQEPLQVNNYQQTSNYQQANNYQQTYRTIPVHEDTHQNKPNELFQAEPNVSFHDFQQDQNRFQYKIYGKPQPVFGDVYGEQSQRQPRYLTDLSTNLRPPPFATVPYQRRILIG